MIQANIWWITWEYVFVLNWHFFFLCGTYGYSISLQVWFSILVVVPFRIYYIISLPIKHIFVVISSDFIMIRNRNASYYRSAKKCEKCKTSVKSAKCKIGAIGWTTLFYDRNMTIGLRYRCILLCLPFGLVFWCFHRLRPLWVSRRVTYNSI